MAKIRVYEMAKELNLESKELVPKLQALGYAVKSHASSLEPEDAEQALAQIREDQKANIVEKRVSRGVIRRRARAPAPPKAPDEAAPEEPAAKKPARRRKAAKPAKDEASPEAAAKAQAEPEKPLEQAAAAEKKPKAGEEPAKPKKPAKKAAEEKSSFYQAKVIRRATPEESSAQQAKLSRAKTEQKPSGIRVLKVVPGKEGRGHEFIDMSKRTSGRRKSEVHSQQSKADLREQLFDAFTPGYVPGLSRRKRMARKGGKKTAITTPKALKRIIKMESSQITASELARKMGIKLIEVNTKLRDLGEEVENLRTDTVLDLATATLVAQEFEYDIQDISFKEESILKAKQDTPADLVSRPPVVTVMGHVDHGKTSILDAIRKTKVTDGEEGGITQHIGAYEVVLPQGSITFIDTPGHEAFTAMRARGASITDIVVLVVAADDGIMPQTIEAIHHAQDANVPILVAINKMDLPGVQSERIRQSLTEYNLVPEEWGGDTIIVEVSAKTKAGLNDLLESILLQAEVLELKGNPKKAALGTVVEARLDRGRGPVSTLLINDGTLKKGDVVVVSTAYGKVRTMFDHEGKTIDKVIPGRPVQIQGLNEVPMAGDAFHVVKNEREARKIVDHRLEELRASRSGQTARLNLEDFYEKLQGVEKLELKVVVKADVQGSAEAVKQALEKLSTDKVSVAVIHHGVGAINETDVNLASASNAMLVGFNTRPDTNAKKHAQAQGVEIHLHKVIYDLTEDIQKAQIGLLPSKVKENVLGRAEVRELFNVPKIGTIAGVSVLDGKMVRGALVRLVRDSVEVHQGKMSSLKRFKEDVREVASGYECGIGLENYNDIKRGDIIEAFELQEEQPTL
jgi:translation initiation factor IF-2